MLKWILVLWAKYNLHSTKAEQSVLGSILLDKELLPDIAAKLKSEDFYMEQHQEIYEAVLDLYDQNQPVDLITVSRAAGKKRYATKGQGL